MINQRTKCCTVCPIAIITVIATCLSLYWPGLYGPLLLDDQSTIGFLFYGEPSLKKLETQLFNASGPLGRPVAMASFFANAWLSQDLFYWKLTNLLIHLATGLAIYAFVRKLAAYAGKRSTADHLVLAVSALWLLHPLQVSTVLYTVQRMAQLPALFGIIAVYFYLLARDHPVRSRPFAAYQALCWLIFFPLAIFSKETALLLPLFAVLLELFVLQRERITDKTLAYLAAGLVAAGLLAFWLKADYFLGGYAFREFTPGQRLLTEARVLALYLGMLLMPAQKRMGFLHDDVELSTGLFIPWSTLPAILLLAALLASAFYARRKLPLYSFGLLFFFAGHLLESTIFPLELMYEHRNYLPSVGFFLALAALADNLVKERRMLTLLAGCYLSLLCFGTWLRADTWGSDIRLYYHIETHHPKSERMAFALASQAYNAKAYGLARKKLEPFGSLGAQIQRLHIDCLEHKALSDAGLDIDVGQFKVADNFAVMGLVDIANLGLDDLCRFSPESFLKLLDEVLAKTRQMRSNRQMLFMYKAHYQWKLAQKQAAMDTLREGFAVRPENPTPLFLACEWAQDEGMKAVADELCAKALSIADDYPAQFGELAKDARKRYKP